MQATTLLADQLFSPALVLAERIERRRLPLAGTTLLELGAGAALPSLLAAGLPAQDAPRFVAITDYPDPGIMRNVERNVAANASSAAVRTVAYEWGADPAPVL
jgi:nicotinamide N-methyltransferase